ncbi:hypothetical protein AVEN_107650-1 [Araneus ventricosus]|uniref:Uncharacterized protein n=1 Tax=Araneus ventricosus TaxID=182803 RepID=A0A4Y2U8I1_ARAVE|nr:hypothetical protein AVEN_231749-1 [Araneus ventricosus]GBO06835.1 hypothetical protein AVEN_133142-1 [Araneus ventricosus]GBO07978.1 hypothetical protein AVEN_95019-1 [Araneus ventricosus]GBO07986.1 hypothetical protein AVEN_107650-1 [Araneus ventricosus]
MQTNEFAERKYTRQYDVSEDETGTTVLPPRENPDQGCRKQTSRRKEGNLYKINRNIWQSKRISLGKEFVFDQSTKRHETSVGSICTKCNKTFSFTPKMQWNIPFP